MGTGAHRRRSQRAQYGETKTERQKDKEGKSPDRGLPIKDFEHMTVAQITQRLSALSSGDLRKLRSHEIKHKNRKGLLQKLDRMLARH